MGLFNKKKLDIDDGITDDMTFMQRIKMHKFNWQMKRMEREDSRDKRLIILFTIILIAKIISLILEFTA